MNKKEFPKPKVFSSKCLGFASCRWNGETIPDKFIEALKPYVYFVTNCPEAEIGLGIPRDPVRIVKRDDKLKMMQLNTEKDVTASMNDFTGKLLDALNDVDGFILKDRSPSCGIKDVKIYSGLEKGSSIGKAPGLFAAGVLKKFPHLSIESEARLTNYNIHEHFLTKLFTIARFRTIKKSASMKELVQFHAENKFLLMAYSQKELSFMGKIVANYEKKKAYDVFKDYEVHIYNAFVNTSRYTSNINVMMHGMGYFSEKLSSDEKRFFLNELEEYRREQVPLSVPISLLRSYIVRFKEDYLAQQTFFNPYPEDLINLRDSGKGRPV
jgi:uncharacterized protein YbgA (DUF1722 family)/uncharacterized protein YbbK (DUF523 family)